MTYATREEYLEAFIDAARPQFEAANAPLPANVRVAVGFTSRGSRGSKIGECWSSDASEDGYFEIFIKPTLADPTRVCDVLTQQLIHAAIGFKAGKGVYTRVATSLGYMGNMKTRQAANAWYAWALPIIRKLGDMPYAALSDEGVSSARPAQTGAMLKLECPVCGWLARATRKHIAPHSYLSCPTPDCPAELVCEEMETEH